MRGKEVQVVVVVGVGQFTSDLMGLFHYFECQGSHSRDPN